MTTRPAMLMCAPDYFGVDYVINPWMKDQTGKVDKPLAIRQWENLRAILSQLIELVFVPPEPGVPDMVFTANAGLVVGEKVIVSRFFSRERQAEEPFIRKWFGASGFTIANLSEQVAFEGAGDALLDRGQPLLWVGHGFRSDASAPALVEKVVGRRTVALKLVDPRFYHLDTCLCPLDGGWLMYYAAAFDEQSQAKIRALVPEDKRLAVSEQDAAQFACNAVNIGRHVIVNHTSDELRDRLRRAGFLPVLAPLSEFMKSGGAAKCLTLKLPDA